MLAGVEALGVPEGITKVIVAMIGGGGSGAAGFDGHQYGGASGRAVILENLSFTPGNTVPIVVGAGGPAVSVSSGNTSYGNSGNTTSFGNHTAFGGQGGGKYGASGGQFAAISSYFQSYFSNNQEAALYSGRELSVIAYSSTTVNVFSLSPGVFDKMLSIGILPFCLCAGNPAYSNGYSSLLCGPLILPNGNSSGYSSSQYSSNYVNATAGKGTDPGCGGGAATVGSSLGHTVSAAGCDGGVFIYAKGGQQ